MNEELKKLSKEIWGKEMEKYVLNTDAMLYIQNLKLENEQLKHNRDKAIEYINNWLDGKNNDDIIISMNNLGNILKGDSDGRII